MDQSDDCYKMCETFLTLPKTIRRTVAYIILVTVYGFTWLVVTVCGMIPHRRWKPTGRIMVTGTFHNHGWFLSHVIPLTRSGVKEVILVIDEPQLPLEKVRFVCPPKWLSRLITRAGAKVIWMLIAGIQYQPDLYMGYHIIPGACAALIAGKLLGRPSCYQMTGAPVGVIGAFPEIVFNLGSKADPSRLLEAMALSVVRKIDCIVVRGRKSRKYLEDHDVRSPIKIITGSIDNHTPLPQNDRDIHLIYVGQLMPIKQVDQFIMIVSMVRRTIPALRALIVGDGPLRSELNVLADEYGLNETIEFTGKVRDVRTFLVRSKVFIMTSKSEGLSIAMAEAMANGVVPVVADVGELGDLVTDGVNGYLIKAGDAENHIARVTSLLRDHTLWTQCSRRAIEVARKHCGIEVVSGLWRRHLRNIINHALDSRRFQIGKYS